MPTRPPRAHPQGQPPTSTRSLRACTRAGCPNITDRGLCAACRSAIPPRPTARLRGYSTAWEKARAGFLAKHPFCECPEHQGRPVGIPGQPSGLLATTVDHIIPHKGDKALFWNRANWQAMAKPCHDAKTAREDGRWGPRVASAS
jgi:5-methylcytosine-specific restriction protein A